MREVRREYFLSTGPSFAESAHVIATNLNVDSIDQGLQRLNIADSEWPHEKQDDEGR